MHEIAKATTIALAALFALAMTACTAPAPSEFAGKWKVTDTAGTPFEITLGNNGTATANRSGEAMKGTWEEEKGAVIISWKDGWTTKIAKGVEGDVYMKTAWDKGLSMDDRPTNTSSAEKVN